MDTTAVLAIWHITGAPAPVVLTANHLNAPFANIYTLWLLY